MKRLPCPRCGGALVGDLYGLCPTCTTDVRTNARVQAAWRSFLWAVTVKERKDD